MKKRLMAVIICLPLLFAACGGHSERADEWIIGVDDIEGQVEVFEGCGGDFVQVLPLVNAFVGEAGPEALACYLEKGDYRYYEPNYRLGTA